MSDIGAADTAVRMGAPPSMRRDATNPWAYVLLVVSLAALPLMTWHVPAFNLVVSGNAALPFRTIAQALYVANALAIFGVAWFSTQGDYRLRPTLVACLCLAAGVFALLDLVAFPAVPAFGDRPGLEGALHPGYLARFVMPFALTALVLAPRAQVLSRQLRWGLLTGTLAIVLPISWFALTLKQAPEAAGTLQAAVATHATAIQWLLIGLHVAAAGLVVRFGDNRQPDLWLVVAALLGGASEACLIPRTDADDILNIYSHVYLVLAQGSAFLAVYGEAVGHPYNQLARSRAEALLQKERIEAVFRSIADGVVVVDNQLSVLSMNPVARNLAGTDSFTGLPLDKALERIGGRGEGSIANAVRDCLNEGRARTATHHLVGGERASVACAVEHSISPICDQSGHIRGAVVVLRDVTERWRLQQQLSDAADYARNLIEASIDAMMVIDMDGLITDVNRAAEHATGLPRNHLVGHHFASCFSSRERVQHALDQLFPDGVVRDLSLVISGPDGSTTDVSCNITPYRDADGRVCGAFAVARDVTEILQVQTQLQFQANHDALTALPNRRHFHDRIERTLALGRSNDRYCAVLLLDLDDFKDINDTLGHAAGDRFLKCIGSRLAQSLRTTDTVARIGGDEFAILVNDFEQIEDIHPIANKLLQVVTAPTSLDGNEVTVSCSIGISISPLDPGDADTLLRNADTALYRAKEAGKNNYQCFTADMNAAVQRRVDLGNRLRSALARAELSLHFQPQFDLIGDRVTGFEALIRWTTEGLGSVSPMEFIPIAENTGLILPIGEWVLEEACRQTAKWCREAGSDVSVAVNLSACQFRDQDIVATVTRVLADSGLPPHLLTLELTESMLMRDAQRAAATMTRLKETGARIAIDDFGTGYSSLSYLKRFPLDHLKIDRSFVMDIPGDQNDEVIVRSIVALAHSLGLKVIAEGVETAEQLDFLRELGCDEVQGFYISRPRPAAELLRFLQHEVDAGSPPGTAAAH